MAKSSTSSKSVQPGATVGTGKTVEDEKVEAEQKEAGPQKPEVPAFLQTTKTGGATGSETPVTSNPPEAGGEESGGGKTAPGGQEVTSESPASTPVGWGEDQPEHLPDQPDFMPGPKEWEVTEEQTVAGQLEKNLEEDSALNENIRDQVGTQAAKAGLKNSLMAMTAAEKMVLDTAFKVSQQDAATYARSAEFNATMANQFSAAEQAFMHQAMLNEQNFKQSQILQKEQIRGQLAAVNAKIGGQMRLADKAQKHWKEQNESLHDQNLETMAFKAEAEMAAMGWQSDLEVSRMDRAAMHDMIKQEENFNMQTRLNYQNHVYGMLQTEVQALGQIGASGAKANQQRPAAQQVKSQTTKNIDLIGGFFSSEDGPANSGSGGYTYYPPPPSNYYEGGDLGGDEGSGSDVPGGFIEPPPETTPTEDI